MKINRYYILTIALIALMVLCFACTKPTDGDKAKGVNATVKGVVYTPLEKALVYVYEAGTDLRGPPLTTIKTSELAGEFKVDLPAGKYFFVARKRASDEAIGLVIPGDYKSEVIGPIATPDHIQVVPGLPKTRSGKIMRRILRKVASGQYDELGDVTTLADPSVVEAIIAGHRDK